MGGFFIVYKSIAFLFIALDTARKLEGMFRGWYTSSPRGGNGERETKYLAGDKLYGCDGKGQWVGVRLHEIKLSTVECFHGKEVKCVDSGFLPTYQVQEQEGTTSVGATGNTFIICTCMPCTGWPSYFGFSHSSAKQIETFKMFMTERHIHYN